MSAGMQRLTGTQIPACAPSPRRNQRWVLFVAGTCAAGVVAAILFQVIRPNSGQAQERAPAERPSQTRYVANVNGQKITYDELAAECFLRISGEVLEDMINRKLIEQACAERNVHVGEAEVDQEVMLIAKKFSMTSDQWYQMMQAERNVTPAQYRRDIIWPMLALKKIAGEQIKITKTELNQLFERNFGERVKARIIVLDNPRRAAECWEKVVNDPDNFTRYVREYSVDQGSKPLDGQVQPIRRFTGNDLTKKMEEEAFKLKPGEISPVIEVGGQWVILLCEGRTEPIVTDINEVADQLAEELKEEKTRRQIAATFEKIKSQSRIDNYLTNQTSGAPAAGAASKASVKTTSGTKTKSSTAGGTSPADGAEKTAAPAKRPSAKQRPPAEE